VEVAKYIDPRLIIPNLQTKEYQEIIRKLVNIIFEVRPDLTEGFSRETVYQEILKRENMQTTAIGNGTAFPHARIQGWKNFVISIGLSKEGIDFQTPDGIPVRFVSLMIASPEQPYIILQCMAGMIRRIKEGIDIESLSTQHHSAYTIAEILKGPSIETSHLIFARDIARPLKSWVTLETSIEEASRKMHLDRVDVLPVVDAKGKYCGVVSCLEIFEFGMPDFFKRLQTISFVKHIDPFEKYFKIKKNLKVQDFYKKGSHGIYQDATLVEIIFEMAVKNKSKLFVLDEDKNIVGVIDRFCIIDKILFL